MARKSPRAPGAPWSGSSSALAIALRAGRPRRHLEARARPGPPGRHPDHADRRGRRPAEENLDEAAAIIDQRVNGSGVAEAEVTTQGNQFIVVEIPGESRATWSRPSSGRRSCGSAWSPAARSTGAAAPRPARRPSPGSDPRRRRHRRASPSAAGRRPRTPAPPTDRQEPPAASGSASATDGSETPSGGAGRGAAAGRRPAEPTQPAGGGDDGRPAGLDRQPRPGLGRRPSTQYECPPAGEAALVEDDPDQPLVTCDDETASSTSSRPPLIEGTDLDSADGRHPAAAGRLRRHPRLRRRRHRRLRRHLARARRHRASSSRSSSTARCSPRRRWTAPITNGQRRRSAATSPRQRATSLATSLKYGALPIAFETDPPVETIGPVAGRRPALRRPARRRASACCW